MGIGIGSGDARWERCRRISSGSRQFQHAEAACSAPLPGSLPHRRQRCVTKRSAVTTRDAETGSGRRGLANETLQSPLASRVAVNRIWHHLFGRGIVPSVDNLGVLGLPPSHPELLDHLATQFVRNGWSTKAMIRSLVLSRTYQMSSHSTDADTADPENELWHRMPIKRLEGEAIRDSLLRFRVASIEQRSVPAFRSI